MSMLGIVAIVIVIIFAVCVPWYNAVIDLLDSNFEGNNKIILFLLVTWFPVVGPMIYYSRKKKLK